MRKKTLRVFNLSCSLFTVHCSLKNMSFYDRTYKLFASFVRRLYRIEVIGAENLFCGGEKAGLLVGHTEAIVTGTLAGANAVRWANGRDLITIPECLAIGDAIAHVNAMMQTEEGMCKKYTFSGAQYFKRMQELGLYKTDVAQIRADVEKAGMKDVFCEKIC